LREETKETAFKIHRCNYCELVYPEHFIRIEDIRMLNETKWECEKCNEFNPFTTAKCGRCETLVKQHLYQQRFILKK